MPALKARGTAQQFDQASTVYHKQQPHPAMFSTGYYRTTNRVAWSNGAGFFMFARCHLIYPE
jgi:hypothetical protein